MEAYGWLLDQKKCIECRACETACKQWNNVETGVGVRYRRVQVNEMGVFPQITMQALAMACNHCEDALCMKVCPAGAIWRTDSGHVVIDREKCLGCHQCWSFCPYGAPQFNQRTRTMEKCTGCFDRVGEGVMPACATLCPTGALQFGKWAEISKQGSATTANFSDPSLTKPRIRFINDPYPAEAK